MIDFRVITPYMSAAFDTDNIVSVTEPTTQTVKAENVPCHLVITQGDTVADASTVADATLPVTMYGKLYFNHDTLILSGDVVVVEKRDVEGNVLATYEGKSGVPVVRCGRKVSLFEITDVIQAVPTPEPEPTPEPDGLYAFRWRDVEEGGYIQTPGYYGRIETVDGVSRFYAMDVAFFLDADGYLCMGEYTFSTGYIKRLSTGESFYVNWDVGIKPRISDSGEYYITLS